MKNYQGSITLTIIGIIAILAIGGGITYVATRSSEEVSFDMAQEEVSLQELPQVPTQTQSATTTVAVVSSNISVSTSQDVKKNDVINQPAYLIQAYTQNGKNFIEVDYIEVLHGQASLQAQVADGKCPNVNNCYDFPNGYKRNQNPSVRTFEINNSAYIEVNGILRDQRLKPYVDALIAQNGNAYYQQNNIYDDIPNLPQQITFTEFKNFSSTVTSYLPYKPLFKKPLTYLVIDVQNNLVTKIIEPYQE